MESQITEPGRAADDRSLAEVRSGSAVDVPGGQESGAPPSNTAPPNYTHCSDSGTSLLHSGIDSLYLSFPGSLDPKYDQKLREAKEASKSADHVERAKANLQLGEHQFQVQSTGQGKYPFVLADNWYRIQVSSSSAKRMPLVYSQISSELLTRSGPHAAHRDLAVMVWAFNSDSEAEEATVSRLDLCVDFVTDENLELIKDRDWISRAKGINRHTDSRQFTGFVVGQGGGLSCRLYDKSLEIEQKSKKTFFYEIWAKGNWDGRLPVWRLEFQFRRDVLRQLGVNHFWDIDDSLNSLWQYATGKWLRLALSSSDKNQSRWATHPLWLELQKAIFNKNEVMPLDRVKKERVPSDEYLFKNGIGAITSFMAREGYEDIEIAFPAFLQCAQDYHRRRRPFTGEDLHRYARDRAAVKTVRFNAIPLKEAKYSGWKYSRAKNGE